LTAEILKNRSDSLTTADQNEDGGKTQANDGANLSEAPKKKCGAHIKRKMREAADAYKKNKGKESLVVVDLRKKKKDITQHKKVRAINPAAVIALSKELEQGNGDV